MLRPDAASREKFYATGRQWGFLNTNDIRAFEKLNPVEEAWAEDYWQPINMTLTKTPLDPNHQDGDGDGKKPDDGGDAADGRYVKFFYRLFRDGFGRILARETRDEGAMSRALGPVLFSIRDAWFDQAAREMGISGKPGAETEKFVAEYIGALATRSAAWLKEAADSTCEQELRRAVRALRIAAYREVASLKAKEGEQE
jgi:hypothetical protein